jgi:hypothetical protein
LFLDKLGGGALLLPPVVILVIVVLIVMAVRAAVLVLLLFHNFGCWSAVSTSSSWSGSACACSSESLFLDNKFIGIIISVGRFLLGAGFVSSPSSSKSLFLYNQLAIVSKSVMCSLIMLLPLLVVLLIRVLVCAALMAIMMVLTESHFAPWLFASCSRVKVC